MAEVVIAVRGGEEAKSRYGDLVAPGDRAAFVEAMLTDMLRAIAEAPSVDGVWVVTPTPRIAALAHGLGARVVDETSPAGLRGAFRLGRLSAAASARKATVVLLPGDLPGLDPKDLEAVIAAAAPPGVVAMVRAARDGGTGALAFPAVLDLPLAYGPDSFARHRAAVHELGLDPVEVKAPSLAHDLDHPSDLRDWLARRPQGAAAALMSRLAASAGTAA
jgi:2-phospho-L-lactate guanylyltransferase